jgi:hypothetical protein
MICGAAGKTEGTVKVSEMEERGSKTLLPGEPMREPTWLVWSLMKGFRVVLLAVMWAGLGMGVGLFCGIVGVVSWSAMTHRTPEMDLAYRNVAIPLAVCAGGCALLWNLMRTMQAAARRRKGR